MMSLLSVCPRSAAQARGDRIVSLVSRCGRRFHCNKFHACVAPAREPMFESGDDMMAVAAESAMIAVMQHDDVAVRPVRARDAREPFDQALGRLRLPVPANFRPHHDAPHSRAANFSAQQRAAVAVRRPHPARRFRASGCGDRVLAPRQLIANSRARLKEQICVRVRVIAEQMAARGNFLHEFRTCPREFSNQEKCRAHGVAIEQFEKARSDGRIRSVVKGESDFSREMCAAPWGRTIPRTARQLPTRQFPRRPPRRSTRSPARDSIRLQAVYFRTPRPGMPAAG